MNNFLEILIVEDNLEDFELLKRTLQEHSEQISVTNKTDVDEAIAHLQAEESKRKSKTNLIILDLGLPKESGLSLLEFVKSQKSLRQIPVIVLTSIGDYRDMLESYKNYSSCFIRKPQDLNEFSETAKAIVSFWSRVAILPNKNGYYV